MATKFNKKNLLLLFYRPLEPALFPKGPNNISFAIPPDYLPPEYKDASNAIIQRFSLITKETVPVKVITIPELGRAVDIPKDEIFSFFNPKHKAIGAELAQIFYDAKNPEDLLAVAIYARFRVNPQLFSYALSVALLHRPDTQDLILPAPTYYSPDRFIDAKTITEARHVAATFPQDQMPPIILKPDTTASDLEPEHRVAYFREDLGVNLHHWQWHVVYPYSGPGLKKDRRGEIFYYMHQQMIARYDFARLSDRLNRVERLIDWNHPIKEAYFPKITSVTASRQWPARVANQRLRNLARDDNTFVDLVDLRKWRDRIVDAIDAGYVIDKDGKRVELTEEKGIDLLGDIVEASDLSINQAIYGNLHNMGHDMLALIHDPDNRNLEPASVMGAVETAMRDPVFYRWHGYINDVFQEHKKHLPSYKVDQLQFPDVIVENVGTRSVQEKDNLFQTFWTESTVNIAGGLDFQSGDKVYVTFTHLNHYPFTYNIQVNNKGKDSKKGTCRIFLAPKYDETGSTWQFNGQRNLFIEMDKFQVTLAPGSNKISRSSKDSSVTIPFNQIFRDLEFNDEGKPAGSFCGCGWPEYMLIPKGTPQGMEGQLFVMISNYIDDKVEGMSDDSKIKCKEAYSYCGSKDKRYPDRRAMGYPFDRKAKNDKDTILTFLTPNMKVIDVTIKHEKTGTVPIGSD